MGSRQSRHPQNRSGFIQVRRCVISVCNPSTCSRLTTCDPEVVIDRDRLHHSLDALESFSGE
ncbi:MAG: hypothetical protein AAF215_29815 [Cyanobacteria bacterium P01_A01_bin.123]